MVQKQTPVSKRIYLTQLVSDSDHNVFLREDNKSVVDTKPIGKPLVIELDYELGVCLPSIEHLDIEDISDDLRQKGANAYLIGQRLKIRDNVEVYAVQLYKIKG